jgi:hypothetical protein
MAGSSRRSKRGQPPESLEEASSSGVSKKAKKLATRVSIRNVNNCCEFGMRNDLFVAARAKNIVKFRRRNERTDRCT